MSKWRWKIAWQSFGEGFAFLLPWLLLPLAVTLLLFIPQAIEPFCRPRLPLFLALLRLSQLAGSEISLGALVAALAGFAIKEWEWTRRELREEIKQARAAIAELGGALQKQQYALALRLYRQYRQDKGPAWLSEQVRGELERTWTAYAPAEMRRFQRYCDQVVAKSTRSRFPQIRGEARQAAEALLWASQNLDGEAYEQATEMMVALLDRDTIAAASSVIKEREHDEGVRTWLRDSRFKTALDAIADPDPDSDEGRAAREVRSISLSPARLPPLWPARRPPEPAEIQAAVRGLDLKVNPFGPLDAAADPLLPELRVQPPAWEAMRQLEPALIVGPPGSGRTAAALLLAHEWQEKLGEECFPAYGGHVAPLEPGETWLNRLACLLGEKLAAFVGHNPYAFLEQNAAGKAAMAQLMYLWAGSEQKLAGFFEARGFAYREGLGARLWQALSLHSGTSFAASAGERELLDLLSQARPASRTTTAVLLEFTDAQVLQMRPVIEEPAAEASPGATATSPVVMEEALDQLLERLGGDHPRYADAETLRFRLSRSIDDTQLHGDSAERRAERAEIVDGLNRFALATLGSPFSAMGRAIAARRKLVQTARSAAAGTLLDLVGPLSRKRIHLKLFGPERAGEAMSWQQQLIALPDWPQSSLKGMLERRIKQVGGEGKFHRPHPRPLNFENALVQLASGSPGRLVALGNELLTQAGKRPGPIELTNDDLTHLQNYARTLAP